ncbi:uncharacterized protein LOC101861911 [Aplysia californica]|uniref:Uncharacterized protein LOC101861911 n=1 Tax=Aplysia californica TaxID=6500 RepID=A0ABM0K469_APLCA|nr:uncharacterized protein LOC101861911 [Aplysia californica]
MPNMSDAEKTLLRHATDSLQAQERLCWKLSQKDDTSPEVREKAHSSLDMMRSLKSSLEGSDLDIITPRVVAEEAELVELRRLTLMHTPSSLTDAARDSLTSQVNDALKGQVKSVVSVTLLTCPWWEVSQRERGEQAKHNILLVIFTSHDQQFFSPANPQTKEKACVIDLGWFLAIELSHFGQALGRGRSRYLETVFCRTGAEVFSTAEWRELRNSLDFKLVAGTKPFLEACLGQAVGGVSKKKKNGGMKLREASTLFEICESLRLLQLADNGLRGRGNQPEVIEDSLPEVGKAALEKIKSFYTHEQPHNCKHELFDLIMAWTAELRPLSNALKPQAAKSNQNQVSLAIGKWMMQTRLQGREVAPSSVIEDEVSHLASLLTKVGGPVAAMSPADVLMVAVAGSAMYNLNTPSSDIDYLVVYRVPTQTLLSSTSKVTEIVESRGLNQTVEYGAYEARTFCEMLLKCSVVILELLFADNHEYMSPQWKELAKHRKSFVTEKAIQQYLGLVKNNFKFIRQGRHLSSPKRDRKLFYQIFHKLHSVEHMLREDIPPVRVDGAVREFIMNVRTQDGGEWSREQLLEKATSQYQAVRESLCSRESRLPENADYELCTRWLLNVRGLSEKL